MERASGILLHPTSLPSRFGIGDLGANAYRFVDALVEMGQKLWQVLPSAQPAMGIPLISVSPPSPATRS